MKSGLFGVLGLAFSACFLAQASTAVSAQEAGHQQQPVDPARVVGAVRESISQRYVLPEMRPVLDAALAQGLATGRYSVSDPVDLAQRINEDLARVGKDRHLNFRYDPERVEVMRSAMGGGGFDEDLYSKKVREQNHGISQLRILPGNVRYLEYTGFEWIGEESEQAIDDAMRFLGGGEAVIIDIRRNGGGSPRAVQQIASYFLPAGQPLVTFYMEGDASPEQPEALAELGAARLIGKPLYVLASGRTASAAEEFAGHVAGFGFGELVGANTRGAGFRSSYEVIDQGFLLSISVGRAVLVSTGKDWERTGIAPTVKADVDNALPIAHSLALKRIASQSDGEEAARYAAFAGVLEAAAQDRQAKRASGDYAAAFGERLVTARNEGKLFYSRSGAPHEELVALGGDRFAFRDNPDVQLEFFFEGGKLSALEISDALGEIKGRYPVTGV
ncbi:S41 family peptidase [Qipengyuania sphaerica]|uniref:S41 family peptidase n=1 Tax=Qipengyuania sphaerica TaxID=2867243 RepID=UPI001C8A8D69|nr:S41 family peptidase [Qipengyuania sphaerica]